MKENNLKINFGNWFFLILAYFACLIIGVLIISVGSAAGGLFLGLKLGINFSDIVASLISIILFSLLGSATYFSIGYFRKNKVTTFFIILSLSIIISIFTFIITNFAVSAIEKLQTSAVQNPGTAGLSTILNIFNLNNIPNPIILIGLTLFFYNILPLINIFRE